MNIEEIRKTFPHIKQEQIYFNHASIGPLSTKVADAVHNYITARSETVTTSYEVFLKATVAVKTKISKLINSKSHQIAFTENVSMGLNLLAQGLEWNQGDEIILNDIEFPSNVYPFMNLQSKGVKVKFAKSHEGKVDVEDYEKLITSKTKLISISLVQFLTGYKADLKALGELCKKHNIIFVVDVIQGAGAVKCDVNECNIDFLIGGSHKWLMALTGLGYFYISDQLISKMRNANLGWLSVADSWSLLDFDPTPKSNAERFQTGTMNSIGMIGLDATLNLFVDFGIENIEKRIQENSEYFINTLVENGFDPILKGCSKKHLSGITSIKIDNATKVLEELKLRNIIVETREGMLRCAPHFYNTTDEMDELVKQLKVITQ